jgi:hypothetical protein
MRSLELTRSSSDKGCYELPGVGSVRFPRRWRNEVVIEVPGRPGWRSNGRGLTRGVSEAIDPDGRVMATFAVADRRIEHAGRAFAIEGGRIGMTKSRSPYVLAEEGRELVRFEPRTLGRKPIGVELLDELVDPQLVLFAAYAVHLVGLRNQVHAGAGDTPV